VQYIVTISLSHVCISTMRADAAESAGRINWMATAPPPFRLAYITDAEGNIEWFERCVKICPVLQYVHDLPHRSICRPLSLLSTSEQSIRRVF
jgi:hypothetical protein